MEREGPVEDAVGWMDTESSAAGLEGVPQCSGGMNIPDAAGGEKVACAGNTPLFSERKGGRDLGHGLNTPAKLMPAAVSPSFSEGEEDSELPCVAGNLSPRLGRLPGCPEVPSLMALNVD